MANRDLLKEAIADAKAVKETAIANAKAALEEAFTPYLKEKLAAKLAEMDDMDEAEDKMAEGMEAEKEVKEMEDMDEAYDMDEAKDEMSEGEDMEEAKEMDEMDLDELLAELDAELNESKDKEEGKEMDEALDTLNDPATPTAKGNMAEAEEEEGEEMESEVEDEEIDLEDMSEEDLKSFIEDVIADMVKSGELEAGEEFEAEEGAEGAEGEEEIEVEDETEEIMEGEEEVNEIDLSGDFPALADMLGVSVEAAKYLTVATGLAVPVILAMLQRGGEAAVNFFKKMAAKKSVAEMDDMDEMKKEMDELKSELNEINLLNSKLLYVNKIFRGKNLNENQKAKVLGAFDKATTVAEVKLVFETLNEGLTPVKAAIKENLGSASKTITAPAKKPILEVNNQFERWQKLAGIK